MTAKQQDTERLHEAQQAKKLIELRMVFWQSLCHFSVIQTAKLVRQRVGNMGSSLGERTPSSPNCRVSAGVKARHPSFCKLLAINDLERNGAGN